MHLTEAQLNLLLSGLYAERQQLHDRMKQIDELSEKLSAELDSKYRLELDFNELDLSQF